MLKFIPAAFCLLVLWNSCSQPAPQTAEDTIDPAILISCEGIGPVKLSYSYEDLEKQFGAKALSEHENNVTGKFTGLWEGEPRHINIYWKEKLPPYKNIRYLEVNQADGPYTTEKGLRVGISLKDAVKMNGDMPVTFLNFYAPGNSGQILSFNGGDIEKETPCISGRVEIAGNRNVREDELAEFREKREVESYDRLLERITGAIGSIQVRNE